MSSSLQEYLKRYTSGPDETQKKKKKKTKKAAKPGAITIIDADPVWQKEVKEESSASEEDEDDAPLVIKDVEVKRMQRLEALKMHRPYISTADDDSGWVEVNPVPKKSIPTKEDTKQRHNDSEKSLSPRRDDRETSTSPARNSNRNLDLSPPRRVGRHDSQDRSPPRMNRVEFSDLSPPRKRADRHDSPDLSPPKKRAGRHDSPDLSPPRKRAGRHDSPDLSPPRKRAGRQYSPDLSPPRKRAGRHDSPDLSPPRKRAGRHDSPDLSPPRKRAGRQDSPDLSPPRKRAGRYDSPDLSPPRKKAGRHDSPDLPPPRKRTGRHDSSDLSPPRKRAGRHDSPDLSPPRKRSGRHDSPNLSPPSKREEVKKKKLMTDGTTAGLRAGDQLAKDIQMKKLEEAKRFKELDSSITGRNAVTVYRDKHGKRLEGVDELLKLQQGEKPKEELKPLEWGKGLAQKREYEASIAEIEAEKHKPFARTRDDPELDQHMREQIRWGDPMAHLVKKKSSEPVLVDFSASEKMKESGFIIPQTIPNHSWLKRGITPPPNRYGIKPGRHWDGVDRSNGYEKESFKRKNESKALQEEAYLWSVADM